MISVILPTYNEAENIKTIIPMLNRLFIGEGINGEIIVVDDNSPDGTAVIAQELDKDYPVQVHVRRDDRGLSKAVIKGFELAKGDICVVMDADLSHPVEKIPEMLKPIINNKCDMVIGSRNISGGGCEEWPLSRRIISRFAGLMARGVTDLSDPTSGFMAIRKNTISDIKLDPLGWKIVLEVAVKANPRIKEIPIIFTDRMKGESKLNLKTYIDYVRHLWRLYSYCHKGFSQFVRFCLVGGSGTFIDTFVLVSLVELASFDPRLAAVFAFSTAVIWNYIFNRIWTFEKGRDIKTIHSFVLFIIICIIGLGIRIGVMHLLIMYANMGESPWYILASLLGIVAATIFNFLGSRYLVFSHYLLK